MSEEIKEEIKEEVKTISAADYRKIFKEQFEYVVLPSDIDVKVKIRKLKLMDFLSQVIVPLNIFTQEDLKGWEDKSNEERESVTQKKITDDHNESMMNHMIVASVVEPKVVLENPKADELEISDIDDMDKAILLKEILTFNGYDKVFGDRVRPFRRE